METKLINPLRAGYQSITLKSKADPLIVWISLRQLIMWLSSVYGPHRLYVLPDNVWACSWWVSRGHPGGSPLRPESRDQWFPGQPVVVLHRMHRYITSHRCSVRFRSGEHKSRSMASIPSSSRNCHKLWLHVAWHCPASGRTQGPLH